MFNKNKLSRFCVDNRNLLINIAYSWCHERTQAEDLVQDAIEKALKNISKLNDIKQLKAWFIKIMLNCWRDKLRKKHDLQNFDDLIVGEENYSHQNVNLYESSTPESLLSQQQTKLIVQTAISQLPVKHKTVLSLIDIYGVSYSEVSTILDIPIGTVMSRISRARNDLLQRLSVKEDEHKVIPLKK